MSKDKSEPQATIKDFLIYVVKKRILPKQAVSQCRKRKQEAMEKGYSLTVKDILLEQGYIASEAEYKKLWDDMQEEFRIRNKIAEKNQTGDQNFSIPENLLEDLLTREEIQREKYSDVPTSVILALESRWKKKKDQENPRQPIVAAALRMTQRIMDRSFFSNFSKLEIVFVAFLLIEILSTAILGIHYYWVMYGKKYQIQQVQIQIPTTDSEIIIGQIQEANHIELQKLFTNTKP